MIHILCFSLETFKHQSNLLSRFRIMDYDGYDEFTITALRSKADERGLPVTGLKMDLISRLQHDDRRKKNHTLFSGSFKDCGKFLSTITSGIFGIKSLWNLPLDVGSRNNFYLSRNDRTKCL